MKAAFLVKYGAADDAFEIREIDRPEPTPSQVLIKVEAFGINFADIMARLGLYRGAPPLPALLGYDVVGQVVKCGESVKDLKVGQRVTALTRFSGYAEYAVAESMVACVVPEDMLAGSAVALSTQYSTARFLAFDMANIQEHDQVLVHAAAGGVGTALVQMALHKKCTVYGTCGSEAKMSYLRNNGVHHPINYRTENFFDQIRKTLNTNGLDVIFDPVGGASVRKGYRLLGAGGRVFTFGLSAMNQAKNFLGKMRILGQFGFYHPVQFLSGSKGIVGVNMLKIADEAPQKIARSMQAVIKMTQNGILKPFVGGTYSIEALAAAHKLVENRQSMGKVVVKW